MASLVDGNSKLENPRAEPQAILPARAAAPLARAAAHRAAAGHLAGRTTHSTRGRNPALG